MTQYGIITDVTKLKVGDLVSWDGDIEYGHRRYAYIDRIEEVPNTDNTFHNIWGYYENSIEEAREKGSNNTRRRTNITFENHEIERYRK